MIATDRYKGGRGFEKRQIERYVTVESFLKQFLGKKGCTVDFKKSHAANVKLRNLKHFVEM